MLSCALAPLLVLLAATDAALTGVFEDCPYRFNNLHYRRKAILTIKGLPTNLVYDPTNNDLHFTLIDLDSLQNDEVQTRMEQYVLADGSAMPIKVDNVQGQAAAYDANEDRVLIASSDGLNVLNATYKASFIGFKDEDIIQLFKPNGKDELYAVMYPENDVYRIDTKSYDKVKIDNVPCAYILAVDKDGNIYYECDSKYVKVLLKDFEESIEFVGIGKNTARAITVDAKDRVVLAANDGLYQLKPHSVIPTKLMNLEYMPSGIAFHNNDLFLATSGVIYKYTDADCYDINA